MEAHIFFCYPIYYFSKSPTSPQKCQNVTDISFKENMGKLSLNSKHRHVGHE